MPVKIPSSLPAVEILKAENIFVMDDLRASTQDIRPLKLLILNLMPLKIVTETDLLRLISNTPLQIELDFMSVFSQFAITLVQVNPKLKDHYCKTTHEARNNRYSSHCICKICSNSSGTMGINDCPNKQSKRNSKMNENIWDIKGVVINRMKRS